MRLGTSWRVGNDSHILFWLDRWVPNKPILIEHFNGDNSLVDMNYKVNEFILPHGEWDVNKLRSHLHENVCKKILAIHILRSLGFPDVVVWNPSDDGQFSIKSAYMSIAGISNDHTPASVYKTIWGWRGPQRVKTLIWLIARDALLTNKVRMHRHLAISSACPVCGEDEGSILHAFRDCTRVSGIWYNLVDPLQ